MSLGRNHHHSSTIGVAQIYALSIYQCAIFSSSGSDLWNQLFILIHRKQRSLYSDQTKIYIKYKSKVLQYECKKSLNGNKAQFKNYKYKLLSKYKQILAYIGYRDTENGA